MYTGGYDNDFVTSGITYKDFCSSYYVKIFDLSANNESYNNDLRPALKRGTMNIKIKFSRSTPREICFLLISEIPATLRINSKREVIADTIDNSLKK